ncbi:MAG: hypothetical protein ACHRXM_35330 [Isosphaerales bacterium]
MKQHREWYTKKGLRAQISPVCQAYPKCALALGQTLVLTALDRARALGVPCTLHRRPGAGPERAVIVCSFEPRRQQPRPANAGRRVAHARG